MGRKNNEIIKKLRFLRSGGVTPKPDNDAASNYKNAANFDTLMTGAANLFVNFNENNENNRKVTISNPFEFLDNVSGFDSFYAPFYQTDIDKQIEERLNNNNDDDTKTQEVVVTSNVEKEKEKDYKDDVKPSDYIYNNYKGKKSKEVFDTALERVAQYDQRLTPAVKEFLTEIAARESGFKINANAVTNAHTGYFQLSDSNIKAFAKNASKEQYIRDPELQIVSALNLIDEFTRLTPKKTLERAKEKGYNMYGLLAGAWAGGNGGVNAFIQRDEDRSDVHHYRKAGDTKAKGVSVGEYIKTFSKLFNNK